MEKLLKNRYLVDFMATVMFFTRIPVNWTYFSEEAPNITRAAWAFPMIGYLIGLWAGFIGDICVLIGLPNFLSCLIAIALSIMISGAFHEDGLADMADGFGAGGSPERVNEIMHDSRLGTYGVVSLSIGLLIRVGLLIGFVELGYSLTLVMAAGFASGKLAIVFARKFFAPSELTKTGSIVGVISNKNFFFATLTWFVPITLAFPFFGICLGISFVGITIFLLGSRSNHYLGGLTGDVLGAIAFSSELLFLLGILTVINGVN